MGLYMVDADVAAVGGVVGGVIAASGGGGEGKARQANTLSGLPRAHGRAFPSKALAERRKHNKHC